MFLLFCSSAAAQVQLPELNVADPVVVSAQAGNQWQLGAYEVWILRGDCLIQQGQGVARGQEAVLWIERAAAEEPRPHKIIAYLEGGVQVQLGGQSAAARLTDRAWLGRFHSVAGVEVRATTVAGKPDVLPPVYWRGMERRNPEAADGGWQGRVQPAQHTAVAPAPSPEVVPVPSPAPIGPTMVPVGGGRRIRVFPRSDVPVQAQWFPDPTGNQWIAVIDSGVNVIVDGLELKGLGPVGTIDVSTDRLVIWTTGAREPDLTGRTAQDQRVPLELYMEGNIVFRQGDRTIHANRMYYDVPNQVGTVLGADMLTPAPSYQGLLRLHADVLQQTAEDRYFAQNAFITSSRMGEPGYRLQAGDIYFEDIQQPVVDPLSGQPAVDPQTGQPAVDHARLATADHNFLFLGPIPVFYWPRLATDLNEPTYYIRRAQVKNDNVYGTQLLTQWNGYELLGIRNKPKGTDLDVTLDYLNKRGFGHGAKFQYDREQIFGFPGYAGGLADFYGIQDQGVDNLGQYRRSVPPEKDYRFRLFWQHRQQLPWDFQLSGELGWISDRNFVEEFFKREWDALKDQTTGLELKRRDENRSLSFTADYRLNDFYTQSDWLPRADHFWLGQSLLGDSFTWHEHSNVAYAQFNRTTVPENVSVGPIGGPAGPFNYLAWEVGPRRGQRLATRQEIDWPFQLGAVKVVPYAMGELARWGEDVDGDDLNRVWGQAGIRASLPMWRSDPTYENDLLNVHGIAHKVVWNAEFSFARASRHIDELPLYDPLDDDSIEAFRRRFLTTTFGLPSMSLVPTGQAYLARFDERYYALRTGLQNWVASPSTEIADDLTAVRLGVEQRWQTKRGPAHDRKIIDWVVFDSHMTLFPDPDRDNFGNVAGLFDYDFRWHVGDRLTLLSDAAFDFFDQGQKMISVGGFLSRPPRGGLYAGFRILEGPDNLFNRVLSLSYSYRMSPKWMSTFGTSLNLGKQRYVGQNFSITRIGESLLISAGFSVDAARKNVGAGLIIEPRFLSKNRLSNVGGVEIPPAGAFGLE